MGSVRGGADTAAVSKADQSGAEAGAAASVDPGASLEDSRSSQANRTINGEAISRSAGGYSN